MASFYGRRISEICQRVGRTEIDPRVIEAWMRQQHGTLDGLSADEFSAAVIAAWGVAKCCAASANAAVAASFGLMTWAEADTFDDAKKGTVQ